jgi:hypothetical protein
MILTGEMTKYRVLHKTLQYMAAELNFMEQSLQKLMVTASQEIFSLFCNERKVIKVYANVSSLSFVLLWVEVIGEVRTVE